MGNFAGAKNQEFTLTVAREAKASGRPFTFLLVGDGPRRVEIEAAASRDGLDDRVRFLGLRDDVPNLLVASDILLLPSLFEGLPIIGLEAQALGLPILASDQVTTELAVGPGWVTHLPLALGPAIWLDRLGELAREKRPLDEAREVFEQSDFSVSAGVGRLREAYGRPT